MRPAPLHDAQSRDHTAPHVHRVRSRRDISVRVVHSVTLAGAVSRDENRQP